MEFNQHRRATMFSIFGGKSAKEAKEWLHGYNDRIIGLDSDDYSMQGMRGWLEADTVLGDQDLAMRVTRFENQTRYIFDCPGCGEVNEKS